MKKSLELSIKCGLKINIMVYDPTQNMLQERFTSDDLNLEAINVLVHKSESQNHRNFKFTSMNIQTQMQDLVERETGNDDEPKSNLSSAQFMNLKD